MYITLSIVLSTEKSWRWQESVTGIQFIIALFILACYSLDISLPHGQSDWKGHYYRLFALSQFH